MRPEARLADAAEQVLERLVAEEVDALLGQVELDLLRRRARLAAGPEHRLVALGHLRRLGDVEVALVHQPLDDLVEQLAELALDLLVLLGVAGGLAAEHLEHVGRELARVHQGLEDGLAEGVHRALAVGHVVVPERGRAAGEPALQQEVAELVEQPLQVDRVGQLGVVLGVGGEAHELLEWIMSGGREGERAIRRTGGQAVRRTGVRRSGAT